MTTKPAVIHLAALPLPHDPLPDDQVVAGEPSTGLLPIETIDGLDVGLWEHSTGVSTDVEADEVFVVLSGRARIEVEGGPTLEVGPGDLGVLTAGAVTRWTVHEPLRKLYVTPRGV